MLLAVFLLALAALAANAEADGTHVRTRDFPIMEDAFMHGYTHCLVTDTVDGTQFPTLAIQCVSNRAHHPSNAGVPGQEFFSVWARDLYWGFLGWAQAGDDSVLPRVKSSIQELIHCKNRNRAEGKNPTWPLNDGRLYIPQAFTVGGKIAETFFPYCSESQVDFLLLAHMYWRMSGDTQFIRGIWDDIAYVTGTVELMDTNGNSLPDNIWGSYDYQYMGQDTEEALMSAKTSAAYRSVAEMARSLGKRDESRRLTGLSRRVQMTMNLPVDRGGLWRELPDGRGHYVNRRIITAGKESVDDTFIPYENLVPMLYGMTSRRQSKAIFRLLDSDFGRYYPLKHGPMYVAPAIRDDKSIMDCSSVPWLGFLDVYLRCRLGHTDNRSEIMSLLIKHAYDVPGAPFSEGVGIYGYLTENSGRSWDNGNFFHCLMGGVYGIEKSNAGITVRPPARLQGFPLTELNNVRWRNSTYDFKWEGAGDRIASVTVNGHERKPKAPSGDAYIFTATKGRHLVTISLK